VPPLGTPAPRAAFDEIITADSVQLFVQRAHAVAPWFKLTEDNASDVACLCRRLDGMPLALELAAVRMKILKVDQLIERLDSGMELLDQGSRTAPTRQQTLKATVDYSYRMLTERERVLFRRLSVFAGGWTLAAAERVTEGEPLAVRDTLGLLERLLDKSLVTVEERNGLLRQSMPHTLREYAHDRLVDSGEEDRVRRRHFDWILDNIESIDPETLSPADVSARRLELDNLRSALGWAIDAAEPELTLRLAAESSKIWNYRGDAAEGVGWMRRALGMPGASELPRLRGRVLRGLGSLYYSLGNLSAAKSALDESCLLIESAPGERRPPVCTHLQGDVARATGDLPRAVELYQRAQAEYHSMGLRFWEEAILPLTASALYEQGDNDAARAACNRCLALGRGRKFTWATSRARVMLAYLAAHDGDDTSAQALTREALAQLRAIQDAGGIAIALRALSQFALEHGRLGEARSCLMETLDIACAEGDNMGLARSLETVACVLASEAPGAAAQIGGAASQLRTRTGTVPWPTEQARIARWLDVARHKIGAESFRAEWMLGETLSRQEATAAARRSLHELPATLGPPSGPAAASAESPDAGTPLTERQREVVALIARGLTNEQIAEELVISPATAKAHVEHVLDRLALHSRAQIAAWAAAHGLVSTVET
jgi:DNA-binding CsgD family transcriptional regulator/tetratricopeptide (TPR) repeat protein